MDPIIAVIIVILARIFIPFLILRFPLAGGLLAIVADISDVMIFEAFGYGILEGFSYHHIDKIFDMWYLFFEFLVVRKWSDELARRTGKVLFAWRFIGFLVFELTGFRAALLLAPNILEFFFLAYLVIKKFSKSFKFNIKSLIIVLLIVGIPNIIKEYLMHFKYPDQTWNFFKEHLFWWLYD